MEIREVYECVPDIDRKCISTRWMITENSKDNKIMEAYLVAHGYKENLHHQKTDTSTCSCEAMHLVMLTTSMK